MTAPSTYSPGPTRSAASLRERYAAVREFTEQLAAPLSAEDQTVQSMPDTSPTKWHRAHVTWFFETFVLGPHTVDYQPFDDEFAFLFNSYYEAAGPRYPRPQRGLITRPGVERVGQYRAAVDAAMLQLLDGPVTAEVLELVELGLHHEQQHQELLLMDIKHVLAQNPVRPAYRSAAPGGADRHIDLSAGQPVAWLDLEGGLVDIGHDPGPDDAFAFDNEGPRHRVWLDPYRIADRLVTCGEWLAFMDDGGYSRPELWLSEGWATVQSQCWDSPLYWEPGTDGGWARFGLDGLGPVVESEPVSHVSHFEADAFARWAGARLPTEAEWEHAANAAPGSLRQREGHLWQWTSSPYISYPGFRPAAGAVGEYNGKFMSNQMVLRGGASITPAGHTRVTYRNFFPSASRWMFSGLRLATEQ